MNGTVLNKVREAFTGALKSENPGVWTVYNGLLKEHASDWETLAAVSVVSAELFQRNSSRNHKENANLFLSMNEMVFDYAVDHAEEIDYALFKENSLHWTEIIPAD